MTTPQIKEVSDNWTRRAERLAEVWRGNKAGKEKRLQAYNLWKILVVRMFSLGNKES